MINKSKLLDFYNNDAESVVTISTQVNSNIPKILSDLEYVCVTGNKKELNAVLHYHAPSFSYVGLQNITESMHNLELKCLDNHNFFELVNEVEEIKNTIKRSRVALSNLIEDLTIRVA